MDGEYFLDGKKYWSVKKLADSFQISVWSVYGWLRKPSKLLYIKEQNKIWIDVSGDLLLQYVNFLKHDFKKIRALKNILKE
jgi:hypothetical protein